MFQKIKNWLYKKFTINKIFSIEEAKNKLLKINNNNIISIYSYPKYETKTIVLIINNKENNIFETIQNSEIKYILQKVSFICLSQKEITEAADVFSLQFFDIKTTATLLHGKDIFKNINISKAHLRRKMEFDIRNKSIYLRQEAIRIPAKHLIHNIVAELKPVIHASQYLEISLISKTLQSVEEITENIQNNTTKYSEEKLLRTISDISVMLEQWADKVEKHEKKL